MKKLFLLVLLVGCFSCVSKETQTEKIKELTLQVDSLNVECHSLQLEIWAQEELIYSQDTTITGLQKKLDENNNH